MNTRSTFNDFLYAITVGSAISIVKDYSANFSLFGAILLLMIVLEDFYSYKKIVAPEDPEGKRYTLVSLYIELSILFTWYGSFFLWVESKFEKSLLWLSLFWAIKGIAGLIYYIRVEKFPSVKAWIDSVNFYPIILWLLNWWLAIFDLTKVIGAFWFILIAWGLSYGIFLILRHFSLQSRSDPISDYEI